ncbi:MAG: T9SS type A sorting domain-containing protein [Flavobacteriales bacterium]
MSSAKMWMQRKRTFTTTVGNGGGIILIKAQSISTEGSCGGLKITANGVVAATSGNDGAGGAGAGGTVVLNVGSFSIATGCKLTISANGGDGGTVGHADIHGAGGAGGQGAAIFSSPLPTTNVTVQTTNGTPGCNNNKIPCTSRAGAASGSDNEGVHTSFNVVLPIELLSFGAIPQQEHVDLSWSTASESDNAWFFVERSLDLQDWQVVVQRPGAGNSSYTLDYASVDPAPLSGTSYYRLRQVDINGTSSTSDVVPVHFMGGTVQLSLFPNPATNHVTAWAVGTSMGRIELFNSLGQPVAPPRSLQDSRTEIDLSALPSGSYVVVLTTADAIYQQRLLVRN